ncbi:MAG: AAA family ATPase [Chloroflexi bacterium]|nr:AAA family ATPase [Chloroflexota bacterium]
MRPIIQSLILHRFRSFTVEQIDFANPTFLVGPNGSGKSNLVDALAFLSETTASSLRVMFGKRGGLAMVRNKTPGDRLPVNLGIGVNLGSLDSSLQGGRYAFEIQALPGAGLAVVREQCIVVQGEEKRYWFDRSRTDFKSNVPGLAPSLEPEALGLPVIGGDKRFSPVLEVLRGIASYAIEPGGLRQAQDADDGVRLLPDGRNAVAVLQEIEQRYPQDVRRINEFLAVIVPHTQGVHTIKEGSKIALEFTQGWGGQKSLLLPGASMSDGTLRALALLLAVFQRPKPSVLVIEEPEATIHPGAMGAILDLLYLASKQMQVIVTTHSPDLLDVKWIMDDHLRIINWEQGASRIRPVAESSRIALQTHLMGAGELLRSNALDAQQDQKPAGHLFLNLK